jgi:hypothetical protein
VIRRPFTKSNSEHGWTVRSSDRKTTSYAPHYKVTGFSYARLAEKVRSHDIETYESVGPDGVMYQIEILFLWDGKPDADIRVIGFAFSNPMGKSISDDFILAPNGTFIGE